MHALRWVFKDSLYVVVFQVIEIAFFHGKSETILRHVLLTLAICIPVLIISLATNCLGFVLELNVSHVTHDLGLHPGPSLSSMITLHNVCH